MICTVCVYFRCQTSVFVIYDAFFNSGNCGDHPLHFLRDNVLTAGQDDDIFLSADNEQITILIDVTDIPGMKLTIDQDLVCFLLVFKITVENAPAGDDDFTATILVRMVNPDIQAVQDSPD